MMQDRTLLLQKTSLGIGDVLNGRYIIERIIDHGGMGIVLGARHIRLDERVAIKILLPDSAQDPNTVMRFFREGQVMAHIKSETIVRVHDLDVTPSGMPFLVMEWLDGQDLKAFCRSRKTDFVEIGFAVKCIIEACEALAEAHAVGIVHRDIKPSNLFLSRGSRGAMRVKLIDFGISKHDKGTSGNDDRTKTGTMLGTTEYMGPEQIRASNRVDGRADIWSLGVTLYKLITGKAPFRASEPVGTCALILGAAPTQPRIYRPDLHPDLEAVILKCLEKNPDDRYSTVRELANALAPFAEREEATVLLDTPSTLTVRPTGESTKVHHARIVHAKPGKRRVWAPVAVMGIVATIAVLGINHRAEAVVPEARRMGPAWQTIPVPTVPSAIPTAIAMEAPLASTSVVKPSPVLKPVVSSPAVRPGKTIVVSTEAPHVVPKDHDAEKKPTFSFVEDKAPTPPPSNSAYVF